MNIKIDHISIIVKDGEENIRFFRDILGFNVNGFL